MKETKRNRDPLLDPKCEEYNPAGRMRVREVFDIAEMATQLAAEDHSRASAIFHAINLAYNAGFKAGKNYEMYLCREKAKERKATA